MIIHSLSKIDAATRQLDLAIELYFQDADPIGIHTLLAAAHGILGDLIVQKRRRNDALAQTAHLQPDRLRFVTRMVTEGKNFFKHADQDQNNLLQFNSNWTDFLLLEAITMQIELTGDIRRSNSFFLLWMSAKYPDVLIVDSLIRDGISALMRTYPALGSPSAPKRTFHYAMNGDTSVDIGRD
jgi:hypothetical protein